MRRDENRREDILRQRADRQRALRVVKYIDYPFILPNSPVELEEGYIVSDKETCDVFASFVFKNVSEKLIRKLNIRLDCYLNQNIPYLHIDFSYSHDDLTFGIIEKNGIRLKIRDANRRRTIQTSESFGGCVFIPLPESYFTKLDVIVSSVEFNDGSVAEVNTVVAGDTKKFADLDNISKLVYSRVNKYESTEYEFPTKVIPQFGENVWLCCCGNKNPSSRAVCERCGREKEWQQNTVTAELIGETREKMVNDPREVTLHDKSKFKQNKYLETEAEQKNKIAEYEKAMRNIAAAEKRKNRLQTTLIPRILLFVGVILLLIFILKVILELR
ncbi:MAG: hypothetical protein IJO64_07585 [Clostridia bacterium]|nr:hypothetical protein [Clostridia bacterium]